MADDPDATPRQRYDVLMRAGRRLPLVGDVAGADRHRRAGGRGGRGDSATSELVAARRDRDHPGRAVAVGPARRGARGGRRARSARSLDRLPPEDGALRCRVLLGLANELYYGASFEERRALVDEGLAMARRLEDEDLLLDACQIAFVSLWSPGTAAERLALVDEAVELAARDRQRAGHRGGRHACARSSLGELGRPQEMWAAVEVARARGRAAAACSTG